MAYNFCAGVFHPRILSSAVTVDGYEVRNLVSDGNKGYMVESYIKPPISVKLWFPVNIDIERVVLASAVGSQRSCGVELYTHSERRTETWLSQSKGEKSASQVKSHSEWEKTFQCIGRALDQDAQYFSFINKRFRPHREMSSVQVMNKRSLFGHSRTSELHCRFGNNLHDVSHLVVRITKATHSSTCAIRWLEVWGQPAFSCPAHHLLMIKDICAQTNKPAENTTQSRHGHGVDQVMGNRLAADASTFGGLEPDLPEEFLDALTQEMMLMPVLLPSGKNIDQSSLDRHIDEQAQWGRLPGDPFTGKSFSEYDKPIPNVPLKARMDQFLLRHPDIARKYDFRVGRSGVALSQPKPTHSNLIAQDTHCVDSGINKLISSKHQLDDRDEHSDRQAKKTRLDYQQPMSSKAYSSGHSVLTKGLSRSVLYCERKCVDQSRKARKEQSIVQSALSNISTPRTLCDGPIHVKQTTSGDTRPSVSTVTGTVDLDCALKLTLAGLPSFLKSRTDGRTGTAEDKSGFVSKETDSALKKLRTLPKDKKPLSEKMKSVFDRGLTPFCRDCGIKTNIGQLYKLECEHVICRQCLLGADTQNTRHATVTCTQCHHITNRKDVVKAHV